MKVSEEAIEMAQQRKKDDEDLRLCINYLICPQCGSKLNTGGFPTFKYECEKCKFSFTSADEAELHKRLKHAEQN